MNVQQKIKILKYHPLFPGLDERDLKTIAEKTHEKIFPPKTIILRQSEKANTVYLIFQGLVKIYIANSEGKHIPLGTGGVEKAIIGEIGIIDEEPIPATYEAVQETHMLGIRKENFKEVIIHYPSIAINTMKFLTKKIRLADKQRESNFSLHLKDRTWDILQTLATSFPNNDITLSQEDLALIIGAHRTRVTEILNELESQNLILLSNRKIHLL